MKTKTDKHTPRSAALGDHWEAIAAHVATVCPAPVSSAQEWQHADAFLAAAKTPCATPSDAPCEAVQRMADNIRAYEERLTAHGTQRVDTPSHVPYGSWTLSGSGPDAPETTNAKGGNLSGTPYRFVLLPPLALERVRHFCGCFGPTSSRRHKR